jgi:hypothetical protein
MTRRGTALSGHLKLGAADELAGFLNIVIVVERRLEFAQV